MVFVGVVVGADLCVSSFPPESINFNPSFPDDYFSTDALADDMIYIKALGASESRVSPFAVGTYTPTPVWFAFVVDQVRSMAVTASAWQSLVVAWGNPSNFIGKVIFPVMTVPLTGLGEFSCSVLSLAYQQYRQNHAWCRYSFLGAFVWK